VEYETTSSAGVTGLVAAAVVLVGLGVGAWWLKNHGPGAIAPAEEGPPVRDLGPAPPVLPDLPAPPSAAMLGSLLPDHVVQRDGRLWSLLDGAELVLVPAGAATVGSADGGPDEQPVMHPSISGFLVDRHEVTIAQFKRFCEAHSRPMPPQPAGRGDRHPVVNVSWEDADAFARWAKRRLPTEAEWERAARGIAGDPYPWGAADEPSKRNGPGADDGQAGLAPCGSYPGGQSGFGVLDAIGNVWEWCADWYAKDSYTTPAGTDPRGPRSGTERVVRGGSYLVGPPMRASFRNHAAPEARFEDMGFRCALSLR
jgi:formylglycine-generating enzyme required for sulfatase activity